MKEQDIICINCPLGCRVTLTINDSGEVVSVAGNECKKGEKYVVDEFKSPVRVLTATVLTEGSAQVLLPVRTSKPVGKNMLAKCMNALGSIKVKPPVKIGEVVITNIAGTGVNLVSTDELPAA